METRRYIGVSVKKCLTPLSQFIFIFPYLGILILISSSSQQIGVFFRILKLQVQNRWKFVEIKRILRPGKFLLVVKAELLPLKPHPIVHDKLLVKNKPTFIISVLKVEY